MMEWICSWWVGDHICGALAKHIIVDSGCPDRHVCGEHLTMWRQFIRGLKVA
jgi:hypothetical protein